MHLSRLSLLLLLIITQSVLQAGVDFQRQILLILTRHCLDCHNADETKSGFRVDAATLLLEGGNRGKAIIAKSSAKSLLVQVLSGAKDIARMPLDQPALKLAEITLIKNWIDQGTKIPEALLKEFPTRRKK